MTPLQQKLTKVSIRDRGQFEQTLGDLLVSPAKLDAPGVHRGIGRGAEMLPK